MRRLTTTGALITGAPTIGALTTAVMLAATAPAAADANAARCGDRERVVAYLEKEWGETQRAFGIAGDRQLLELFASEGGSWTILLTSPRGSTCLMAAGRAFQAVEPEVPKGDPA